MLRRFAYKNSIYFNNSFKNSILNPKISYQLRQCAQNNIAPLKHCSKHDCDKLTFSQFIFGSIFAIFIGIPFTFVYFASAMHTLWAPFNLLGIIMFNEVADPGHWFPIGIKDSEKTEYVLITLMPVAFFLCVTYLCFLI